MAHRQHKSRPPRGQKYPIGFVECKVEGCNKQFRTLYRHLASHSLTAAEYRILYPGAPTACEEVHRKQRQGGAEGNEILRRMPADQRRKVRHGSAPDTTTSGPDHGDQNGPHGEPND